LLLIEFPVMPLCRIDLLYMAASPPSRSSRQS
ncbi:uncharacterized, partial [Tachysurus ichikawai]